MGDTLESRIILSEEKTKFELFLERYQNTSPVRVIIFGAGDQGFLALKLLKENGVEIYAFCDNDPNKQGTTIKELPVLDPNELKHMEQEVFVIINDSFYKEKQEQIKQLNMSHIHTFRFDVFNPLFKGFTKKYVLDHLKMFEKSYQLLEDEESRNVFCGVLNSVLTGDLSYYEEVMTSTQQYFQKNLIPKLENHIFVDIGAYNGDTIEQFLEFTDGKYERIYAFEPMSLSIEQLEKNLQRYKNVEVHKVAASNRKGKHAYYYNDYGDFTMATTIQSQGANDKLQYLITDTVDNIINGQPVSFIKMDIEGSELSALQGASETIKTNHPFLAICVYHRKEDLIDIISYCKKLVPEYKLYLRHHSVTPSDTVLYCVYEEGEE